jgi:hypothetical protein
MAATIVLSLTNPLHQHEPAILVPFSEAARLRREDACQELSAGQAVVLFKTMDRLSAEGLRRFVHAAALSSFPLRELGDPALHELVCQAIRLGRLVAVRPGGGPGATDPVSAELRRLVRQIEQRMRGRLSHAGRSYKLVADVDLAKVPRRSHYEVVGHDDAVRVLAAVATGPEVAGDLAALLGQARARLSRDWRPPISQPDGLVLLRAMPALAAVPSEPGPALTPSQLQQLAQPKPDKWIKIHLLDAHSGEGIDRVALGLKLPNATEASSYGTDDDGLVDVDALPPGTFSIESADDQDDWVWELVAHEEE